MTAGPMRAPTGERSSFYRSALPGAAWHRNRDDELVELARRQRVLHVGCADTPLTQLKLRQGDLLHAQLLAVVEDVVGIDIDGEGLEQLEQELGGRYVEADAGDADAMTPVIDDLRPTVILAADVIEHVRDPGRFVDSLARCARRCDPAPRLIISTPNGLSARTPVLAYAGTELIHPDHRVVYTPASLSRTLADSGFRAVSWTTYSITLGTGLLRRTFDLAARTMSRVRPLLADGMIVVAEIDT